MSTPTLEELLTVPTQQQVIDDEVQPEGARRGVRITDWSRIAVYRAMTFIVSRLAVMSRRFIAAIAAAGFEDYVFARVEVPGGHDVTPWAPLIAKQRYGIERIEATHTKRRILLTNETSTAYNDLAPGDIIILFPSTGNRYLLDEAVSIPAMGAVEAVFRSEFPVDSTAGRFYVDITGADIVLVTNQYVGVTATNPAPTYSEVTQVGSGVGSVTAGGTPPPAHSVIVRIDVSGTVTDGTVRWTPILDGVAQAQQSGASVTDLDGTGINITLADNGGDPAFVAGTTYFFTTPGSDLVEVGRDAETPQELGERVRGIWPLLAAPRDPETGLPVPLSPTTNGYATLVKTFEPEAKNVLVETDPAINNRVNIYVAGQGAPLSTLTRAGIQAYLDGRNMTTDDPVVFGITTREIVLGEVHLIVPRGRKATIAEEMRRRLTRYFHGVDPATPLTINGLLDHAYIASLIRLTPGVVRFPTNELMTINGVADDRQLPLGAGQFELAVWSQDPATAFTWEEI